MWDVIYNLLMKADFILLKKIKIFLKRETSFIRTEKDQWKSTIVKMRYVRLTAVSYNIFIKVTQLRLSGTWYIGTHSYRCVIRRSRGRHKKSEWIHNRSNRCGHCCSCSYAKTHVKMCVYECSCADVQMSWVNETHCKFN